MIGAAFIVSQTGWACSNDAIIDLFQEALRNPVTGKITAIQRRDTVKLYGVFGSLNIDDEVEIVFKSDDQPVLIGFNGRVKAVGAFTIINILNKTDRIKEILSKIVIKN